MDLKKLPNDFKVSTYTFIEFAQALADAVSIKDVNCGRYIYCNRKYLNMLGLNQFKEVIGFSLIDLEKFMRPYWKHNLVYEISKLDRRVIRNQRMVKDFHRIVPSKKGTIRVFNVLKIPVANNNSKLTAIISICQDITHSINPFDLLNLYKDYNETKTGALIAFSKSLGIDNFFRIPLTEKEIVCLLHLKKFNNYRKIAAIQQVSVKTVESHISNIINKLIGCEFPELLNLLRDDGTVPLQSKLSFWTS